MKKRVLSLLLVLMMVLSLVPTMALAEDTAIIDSGYCGGEGDGSNLTWTLYENGTLEISGKGEMASWTGSDDNRAPWYNYYETIKNVIIDNKVTSIGDWAFSDCSSLTSVMIPDSVTSIGDWAFSGCTRLTSIKIPNRVTSISSYAFSGCSSLTSAMIPNSVTSIGDQAFCNCTSLTSIEIPNSVTSIGHETFRGCTGLTSIKISDSVTSIGKAAFYGCSNLTSVTIPNSVTSINDYAFFGCTSLTSITIPNSVTSIDYDAFDGCTSLMSINVADENTAYCSVDGVLFNKDKTVLIRYPAGKSESSYAIPDSAVAIGRHAFNSCTRLASVKIPNSVTGIPDGAFSCCTGLTSITIPNSVTYVGYRAFNSCANLTSIVIPNSVERICYDVFTGCTDLMSINVADDNRAYSSVSGILFDKDKTELIKYPEGKTDAYYTIPDSVTSIGTRAFYGCTGLTSVEIPNSVTYIDYGAFDYCTSLTSIEIPNSITSISEMAFWDCTSLMSITIPDSVTSIGAAFRNCTSLADVYYTGNAEQWSKIAICNAGNDGLLNATIHYNYHEHVTELRNAVEPSCTEAGYTGDEVCTICGETIEKGEVIEATGHHFKGNTCPDCGATRSTADTIRAWFQDSFNNFKSFFDKLFGR